MSFIMLPEQSRFIEELHHKYFQTLTLYATSILHDSYRAQDVVQDTFHEAMLQIETVAMHKNPGGWLMVTLKNKIKDSERAYQRYARRFLSLDTGVPESVLKSNGDLSMDKIIEEDVDVLEKIEQILTPPEYKLLKRLVFDKASHLQVAKEFEISVYASEKRLERIRQKLYKFFPERTRRKRGKNF